MTDHPPLCRHDGNHVALAGSITLDTERNLAVVHDGMTPGGHPLGQLPFASIEQMLCSTRPAMGVGSPWVAGPYWYTELSPQEADFDLQTATGVKLALVLDGLSEVNVHALGVRGDGKSDDAPALNRAIARAQKTGAILRLPAGTYRYGSELEISDAITLRGAGIRYTIFQPMGGYSGWFMSITESNFINTSNQGPRVNLSNDTAGLTLAAFSVRSSRDLGSGPQNGIRCVGRNDRMRWHDIYIECLEGTHFHFGHPIDGNEIRPAFIRECDFYNIESRGGGDLKSGAPAVIIDSYGPGDATNLCNFFACRIVYPYGTGLDIVCHATRNAIRRLTFFNLLMHGAGSVGVKTDAPLMHIRGAFYWSSFYAFQLNSTSSRQVGVKTEALNGRSADGLRFEGDISSGAGEGFAFDAGGHYEVSFANFGNRGAGVSLGDNLDGPVLLDAMGKQDVHTRVSRKSAGFLQQRTEQGDHRNAPMRSAKVWVATPRTPNDPGMPGDIARDAHYAYICVAPNQWVRMPVDQTWD
ncbi:glycoside hydrolase family 55 protein [Pseudooceanicola sp. CBS1P-1]|uniref:Rhamnogalacturonase A/B/Epimerase-like pectate lyase domain-containing protein n=1 Tax=Pseudooceanicola albus TaxID=2692189 RepID=A0A6L7G9R1_9RHOB|nr:MULTISPECIES: glycosyl hydrolase family 28-related protein [Pseudooceanicola]MBT9386732.1 glycoside hydrolase family 55 protein [Pseudooceanicola endophyticus]MXN20785.1 hypothetical protein [Pseudooceanicola albus]